jgi:hypothetical protein
MQVIVVPADDSQPCTTVAVPDREWHAGLARLAGPAPERAVYDRDAALWLDGDGAATQPPNRRATRYAFGESEAGRQHRTDPAHPPYWLYGTVLVTGAGDELPGDAPARLYAIFGLPGSV